MSEIRTKIIASIINNQQNNSSADALELIVIDLINNNLELLKTYFIV